ncbi:MAG: response regulator [Planctomycetes bacterium]|jgi:two-component system KDP operon response regulator KdpE|nr:response regulator [Planctomycetota bacterium]
MAIFAPLILLIEDELPIRRFLRTSLSSEDYRFVEAESGQQAIRLAARQPPDLVILDLGLPDIDGQDVLRQLREWLKAPIIILSARDQEKQKVTALDNGADDYLTKPFSTAELLARIRVALRHANKGSGEAEASTFATGDLKVDLANRKVLVKEQEIHLTPLEYKLLTTLVKHAGKVLTHRFLLNEVWGPLHGRETHYLRVFMASLRRKIEEDASQPRYLITEQGVGYRFTAE